MAINFTFSQNGTSHFAKVIGGDGADRFLVGRETVYQQTKHGLFNLAIPDGIAYDPGDYAANPDGSTRFGFWAYFIAPTAKAESRNSFVCLNTYDRARFTFGFMQYAAHIPEGDFVRFFKELLRLPNAAEYFPKLVLRNNRICYRESSGALTQLENAQSTEGLMNYLNPSLNQVENQEKICAARMVHWATDDPKNREIQVRVAVDHFKENMRRYAQSYNLDGYPDRICQLICDIRHQGRASSQHIINALDTGGNFNSAYNRLLQLGQPLYASRINTVRTAIRDLINAGIFGKHYQMSSNEFV